MRVFLFLSIFFASLKAAYLLQYGGYEFCIDRYSIRDSDRYIDVVLSRDGKTYTLDINIDQIYPGYRYNSKKDTCNLRAELKRLGLDYYQYNFLFALAGVLIGFAFLHAVLLTRVQ